MAEKSITTKTVDALKHDEAKRKNIPTDERELSCTFGVE